jgi:hypothetical protein
VHQRAVGMAEANRETNLSDSPGLTAADPRGMSWDINSDGLQNLEFRLELGIEEDIEGELEHFVRLARLGLVEQARETFEHSLLHHLKLFPVLAEYSEFLLAEGRYEELIKVLPTIDLRNDYSDGEWWLVELLHSLSGLHTARHVGDPSKAARDWYIQIKCPPEGLDDIQVQYSSTFLSSDAKLLLFQIQCLELYLTIVLAACDGSFRIETEDCQPPNSYLDAPRWHGFSEWSLMLLKNGRQWEAQKVINLLLSKNTLSHQDSEKLFSEAMLILKNDNDNALIAKMAITNQYVRMVLDQELELGLAAIGHLRDLESITISVCESFNRLLASPKDTSRYTEDCRRNLDRIRRHIGFRTTLMSGDFPSKTIALQHRMAELPIAGTIIGLVRTGAHLIFQLANFIEAVKDAPESILEVQNELESVNDTLQELKAPVHSQQGHLSESLKRNIARVTQDCTRVFSKLKRLIDKLSTPGGSTQKFRFVIYADNINAARSSLQAQKASLTLILQLALK